MKLSMHIYRSITCTEHMVATICFRNWKNPCPCLAKYIYLIAALQATLETYQSTGRNWQVFSVSLVSGLCQASGNWSLLSEDLANKPWLWYLGMPRPSFSVLCISEPDQPGGSLGSLHQWILQPCVCRCLMLKLHLETTPAKIKPCQGSSKEWNQSLTHFAFACHSV